VPEVPPEAILDYTQDKIALVDADGVFTYVNAAVERLLGYSPSEMVGTSAFEYVHPNDLTDVRAVFDRALDDDAYDEATIVYRYRRTDGEYIWLESRIADLPGVDADQYVISSVDVTERMEAETRSEELGSRLREIAATTNEVIWMFDDDWSELLFINDAYEDIYGAPIETLRDDPRSFLDYVHPDDVERVRQAMVTLAAGEVGDVEYRVNPRTDYRTWVWVHGQPIVEDGEVVRIVGVARDVTERHRRERQLYVLDTLLRHNVRNDLNVMMGTAARIAEAAPEVAEHAAVIERTGDALLESAEKGRQIIEVLTDPPTGAAFDVAATVRAAVEGVRDRHPHADVSLSTEPARVHALRRIGVAVAELVENAIRHADDDAPSVTVSVVETPDHATVEVCDESGGLAPFDVAVLEGEHEMDDIYHSSGLGLWLVYWLVELSDGTTAVTRNDDGACVELRLPRADD